MPRFFFFLWKPEYFVRPDFFWEWHVELQCLFSMTQKVLIPSKTWPMVLHGYDWRRTCPTQIMGNGNLCLHSNSNVATNVWLSFLFLIFPLGWQSDSNSVLYKSAQNLKYHWWFFLFKICHQIKSRHETIFYLISVIHEISAYFWDK